MSGLIDTDGLNFGDGLVSMDAIGGAGLIVVTSDVSVNAIEWGSGNELEWGTGNELTWGT